MQSATSNQLAVTLLIGGTGEDQRVFAETDKFWKQPGAPEIGCDVPAIVQGNRLGTLTVSWIAAGYTQLRKMLIRVVGCRTLPSVGR